MFLLTITAASGYVKVVSFPSAFDRALVFIALSAQPVTLVCTEDPA